MQYDLPLDDPEPEDLIQVEIIEEEDPNKPAIAIWEDGSYSLWGVNAMEAVALLSSFMQHIIRKHW